MRHLYTSNLLNQDQYYLFYSKTQQFESNNFSIVENRSLVKKVQISLIIRIHGFRGKSSGIMRSSFYVYKNNMFDSETKFPKVGDWRSRKSPKLFIENTVTSFNGRNLNSFAIFSVHHNRNL